ncbi:unnamed protein product [Paramecium primaurelia]|uniref:Uncharacterized protein n=1 Tax=Paramecium primaurelia TaxID=5886 RepID=A0A8S1MVJ4_PARPR|nr:unnamed protein product [Paramecium primaurelia]
MSITLQISISILRSSILKLIQRINLLKKLHQKLDIIRNILFLQLYDNHHSVIQLKFYTLSFSLIQANKKFRSEQLQTQNLCSQNKRYLVLNYKIDIEKILKQFQ